MPDDFLNFGQPDDEMIYQMFPSLRQNADPLDYSQRARKRQASGGGLGSSGALGRLAAGAGSGLPFMVPYVPGVSGMRMVGTGGVPGYGGLTTQQIFGR